MADSRCKGVANPVFEMRFSGDATPIEWCSACGPEQHRVLKRFIKSIVRGLSGSDPRVLDPRFAREVALCAMAEDLGRPVKASS